MQKQGQNIINKIITKIEQEFNLFFKVQINDEFDIDQIHQFRDTLRSSPQNYEQIIYQNLGFNKKYKQFVQSLKNNNQFMESLKPISIKAIHRLMLKQLKLGKNTNFIYKLELDPIMEWSLQNIIKENQKVEKQMFREKMKNSKSVEDFFLLIEDYFLDCCIRKLDISETILNINRISLQATESLPKLREVLRQITCSDFVRLFTHFFLNKEYFGQILHRIASPIPILFNTKSEEGLKQLSYPQLLNFIVREKKYGLITSFGTSKLFGKGKTTFLQKMFLLNKKNLSNAYSYFHQGSVDFYTKVPHKLNQKSILVADFHGDYSRQSQQYSTLLKKCLRYSSVIFIHLSQRQGTLQTQQNAAFLQRYNKQILPFLPKENTIILLRDCRQIEQQIFFEKHNGLDSIKLPNFTQNQNLPVIQLRFDKIYKKMQEMQTKIEISSQTFLSKECLVTYQKDKQEVDKLMKLLIAKFQQNNNLFYDKVFPNLSMQLKILDLKQKTIKSEIQIRQEGDLQDERQILITYNVNKEQLAKLSKEQPFPISQLAKQVVDLLHNKHHLMHLFAYELSAWRQSQTSNFLAFIISKTVQYSNIDKNDLQRSQQRQQIKQLIKTAQQTLQCYDISIDTFFSQIIAAMQNKRKLKTKQGEIINYYYEEAYKGIMPINLIEGKTLQFGNPFLQQFFDNLSKLRYRDKQVFVVSVVGAQSSAKSTILNYIFRCNFATSVGRCTKGVYFTIVQCQQKVIVVIDTQGLLSVAARDHTFDVQIASFVMLISDLVIMNNKGEVNATLRDLLGVCIYAIDQITSSDQNEVYQPNKIIFTIRDQVQYGGSKQKQMLSMIIKSLNQNVEIRYSKYIDFTQEDIYPLQSAFTTQNVGNFCIEGANNSFGKSIMALRTRIISMLTKPKNKTLTHFYLNSKRRWQSIQGCGESIFNFKVLYSIRIKQDIKQLLQNFKKQLYSVFISDQEIIISKYFQKQLQSQNQIEQELRQYYLTFKKNVLEEFNRRCDQRINEKELLRQFQFQVQEFCGFWHRDYLLRYKKRLIEAKFQQQKNKFKVQIRSMLSQSITNRKSDFEILEWLQQQKYNLKKTLISQMQRVQSKQKSLGQNQLTIEITRKVQLFLRKYYKKMNVSYQKFQQIKEQYSQINESKVKRDKILLYWFKIKILNKNQLAQEEVKKDKQQIVTHICNFLNNCERTVNSLIKFELNADIHKIDELMKKIMEQLLQDYQILMQNLRRYFQKYQLQPFDNKQKGIILSRFISTFPKKFQKTYYQTSKNNLQIKITQQQKVLDQLTKEVKQSLAVKGNNREIAKSWIKKIIDREIDRYLNYNRLLIQHSLNQVCSIINPKDLIKMALQPLCTSEIRSKQRWINCFKIVKNINRYLKQYLDNRPEMLQVDRKINDAKKEAEYKIQTFLKMRLKTEVKTVISKQIKQGDIKNIIYYQKQFGIQLSTYRDIDKLDEILMIIETIADNLAQGVNEFQYFKSYIFYQLDDKIRVIRKYFNSYIAENIEPIIVGCNSRCPGCGMKCYKTAGHVDGHALWQESHVLQCFKGKVYHETNVRSRDLCFTSQNIFEKYVFLPEENTTMTVYNWIKTKYPQWLDHYLDKRFYTHNKGRSKQLNKIWAHIQYVLIKYKFKDMIPDKSIKKDQLINPLEEEDIINNRLQDY